MSSEREALRLQDIIDNIDRISNHISGMGNALRHDYDSIDLRIIWNTAAQTLPALRADCCRALTLPDE